MSSNGPSPTRAAARRLGALGHRQDDGRRAAGAGDAGPGAVALLHVAERPGREKPTESTIISLPAHDSRTWSRRTPFSSGRTSSATCTAPARRMPSASWRRAATWCSSSTSRARARCGRGVQGTVGVFVLPPSYDVLERRLRGRSKDSEEAMQRRLRTAREEVAAFVEYDYVVVNDELDACVERLRAVLIGRAGAAAVDAWAPPKRSSRRSTESNAIPEES